MTLLCMPNHFLSPQVNPSTVDWPLQAALSGGGFTGPETIVVKALTTTCYPLTFHPRKEGVVEVCENSSHFNTESHANVMTIFIQILCDFHSYTFLFSPPPPQFPLLSFDPSSPSHLIQGVLHLVNTNDGMEHTFQLRGIAERPLAQDYITLHAQAKKRYMYMYINHLSEKDRTRCYSKDNHCTGCVLTGTRSCA